MEDALQMEVKQFKEGQAVPESPDLYAELIRMVYKAAPLYMMASLINSAILISILWKVISHPVLILWLLANVLITTIRYFGIYHYKSVSIEPIQANDLGRWFTIGLVFNGIVWGWAGIFLFSEGSTPHQVFLAFVLGGMVTGAIGAYAALAKASLLYILLIMLPITARFLIQGAMIQVAMGGMLLLFTTLVLFTTRNNHLAIITSLKLRFENTDLITYLRQAKEHTENLNEELQAEMTARKSMTQALNESEETLKTILEASPISTFVIDRHHRVIHWNKALEKMSGIKGKEAIGSTQPWKAFYSQERPCLANLLMDDLVSEIPKWYSGKYRTSELIEGAYEATDFFPNLGLGEKGRWLRFSAAKISDGSGNTLGAIETLEDITERVKAEEALQKSEEYFRALIENASDYITLIDDQGVIRYESPSVARDTGFSSEGLYGKKIFDLLHPEDLPEARAALHRLIENPDLAVSLECRVHNGENEWRILHAQLRNCLANSCIQGIIVNSWDITEHKKTMEDLLKAEENYRKLFENVPVGIFRSSPEGKLLEANPALAQIFGYPCREDLMKVHVPDLYAHAEDRTQWQMVMMDREGIVRDHEIQFVRTDGRVIWIKGTSRAFRDSSGKVLYYEGVLEDITERKEAESRLRESEKRFRDLVEQSLTGTYIVQNNQIAYYNSELERIRGPIPPKYQFDRFADVHPEDLEKVKKYYQEILVQGMSQGDIDVRLLSRNKAANEADYRWYHVRGGLIEYEGQKAGLFNILDITKTIELKHLAMMNDKMSSLGRVAAGIIHELRSPLSGINVYLTTLKKMFDSSGTVRRETVEKVGNILEKLQSASNKIEMVIKRVMDFAKPGASQLTLTDINQSIEEAMNLSRVTLQKSGIKIERELREEIPPCYADPHLIEQVILNLITNGAQAMQSTGGEKRIGLTSWAEGNFIYVGVADSGPGIPPTLRKKVFDPFFTTKQGGVGIGLSLCYRIIADHGGALSIHTSKWGGAEFRIQIPIEKRNSRK